MTTSSERGGVRPPHLPADDADREVPQAVRDFVDCRSEEVVLAPGRIGWMGLPGGVRPDIRFAPGPRRGDVEVVVGLVGLGIVEARIAVDVRDGGLRLDTSALPDDVAGLGDVRGAVAVWVHGLNDWFAQNGKEIGEVRLRRSHLRVTKTERGVTSRTPLGPRLPRRALGLLAAAGIHTVATGVVAAVGVVTPDGGARRHHHHRVPGREPGSGEAERRTVPPDPGG